MIMIILSAFFFACMNVSVRLAGDLPSVEKSFFRNLVAAVFAAVILCKNRTVPKVDKKYWGPLILRCVCGTLGILCNFYAIDHLLVADASILNKLSPFFAIIFSFLLLKEKIRPAQAACVALAFIGCLFVVKPGFQNAALVPAPVIVFYFSFFSCLSVVPWMLFHFTPMSMKQLVTLLMAGLFAAGGQFTITAAYTYAPAGKISIFDYSQIIFATMLGFVLFGEIPDKYSFTGYVLIILASLGTFLYNMRVAKAGK